MASGDSSNDMFELFFLTKSQTADLRAFLSALRPDIPSTTTFTLTELDGGSDPQSAGDAGIEADLDVQVKPRFFEKRL